MSVDRGRLALVLMLFWVGIAYVLLVFLGHYTVKLYFTVILVGFLSVRFLFAPPQTSGQWWSSLRWVTILALLVFGYIIFEQVMAVIQP